MVASTILKEEKKKERKENKSWMAPLLCSGRWKHSLTMAEPDFSKVVLKRGGRLGMIDMCSHGTSSSAVPHDDCYSFRMTLSWHSKPLVLPTTIFIESCHPAQWTPCLAPL